uniref:Uncharacterized protein n=1 Tax=Setaria digitata TaxID=48799 RepID=A0A915PIW3_9BILA
MSGRTTPSAAIRSMTPSMDISMASVSSLGSSSLLDHSMIMSGSWNNDAMVNSQATYTIVGSGARSHYQLLEEIECPSELIEVDDDVPYPSLNTSLVLEESRIGVDRLPIVDDNLSTPLVEYAPSNDSQQYQQHQAYMLESYANKYHVYQDTTDLSNELPVGLPIPHLIHPDMLYESGFPEQLPRTSSPTDRVPSSMSIDSAASEDLIASTPAPVHYPLEQQHLSPPEQEVSPVMPTTSTEKTEQESITFTTLDHSLTITKGSEPKEHAQQKSSTTEGTGKEEKKGRPKKPRPLSVRELQNAPVPVRPPKPKPPSKSQLMMEQLKASIEADKLKPKKNIKSKLHDMLALPPPVRRNQSPAVVDENQGCFLDFRN